MLDLHGRLEAEQEPAAILPYVIVQILSRIREQPQLLMSCLCRW